MAFILQNTDATSGIILNSGDEYLLTEGTTHTAASGTVLDINLTSSAFTQLFIQGNIVAPNGRGVSLDTQENVNLVVASTGSITSTSDFFAVSLLGDDTTLTNMGEITGATVRLVGNDAVIMNTGTITSFSNTMQMTGANATFSNLGVVQSHDFDLLLTASNATLFNSGTMTGTGDGFVVSTAFGVLTELTNTGQINVGSDLAISGLDGAIHANNSGTIDGNIDLSTTDDRLENSGTINGFVELGNGDDLYAGALDGLVTGEIHGGSGNDTLRGSNAGDNMDGGTESDLINGRSGDDTLMGDTGADTIFGGDGNDVIDGEVNDDIVNGNAGDDTISGSGGNDTLRGGRDDDEIRGGTGDDNIRGDSGDDLIIGGDGRDDMFGGSGTDVFLFEDTNDSGLGAVRDRIYDFRSGEDTIDISGLVGGAISYIGSSNFSGTGGREVRAVNLSNGTLLYIDTNGDGARDSDIFLIGTDSVTEGDFLL